MARLANYEDGRGCLRCGIAFEICRHLVISEQWLATGTGDKNAYRGVLDEFPENLMNKSFLDLYENEVEPLYERAGYPDSFVPMLRYDGKHPADTWKIACVKLIENEARSIKDEESLSWYWMDVAKFAGEKSFYYSKSPRDRLTKLNKKLSVSKAGKTEPFSYEKFYDDLALIGLEWPDIESIAKYELPITKEPIPVETIIKVVVNYIEEYGTNSALKLYQKIHCKDE